MSAEYCDLDIEKIKKGVVKGNAEDLYALGIAYYKGIKINKNIPLAIKYLIDAASKDFYYAYTILGDIYSDCDYDGYKIDTALSYYSKAADNGDYDAIIESFRILLKMYNENLPNTELKLIKLKSVAAKHEAYEIVRNIDHTLNNKLN